MNAIDKRIENVKEMTARDFTNHKVEVLHEVGLFRTYRCADPNGCFHHFYVNTFPGYLVVTGDCGDFVFARDPDMLEWARGSIDSIHYFAEKCVAGNPKVDFCPDVAFEWIEMERATLKAELVDVNEVEDEEEINEVNIKLKQLAELEELLHDSHEFINDCYVYCNYDAETISGFWNYSYSFLTIREGIIWMLNNIPE